MATNIPNPSNMVTDLDRVLQDHRRYAGPLAEPKLIEQHPHKLMPVLRAAIERGYKPSKGLREATAAEKRAAELYAEAEHAAHNAVYDLRQYNRQGVRDIAETNLKTLLKGA